MKRARYPAEFKAEAVKQVTDRGHGVVEVAKRLGVSDKCLYLWVRLSKEQQGVGSGDPFTVTAMWLVSANERCLSRSGDYAPTFIVDHSLQAILDILVQTRVRHQFGRLGPFGHELGLPLSDRRPILKLAAASCSIACQLPGDG